MRVLTRANIGGPAQQAVALYHGMAERGVATLLVVGTCEAEPEVALAERGVPELSLDAVCDLGPAARGFVRVPTMVRKLAPGRDRTARRALRRLMQRFEPDVVHTHTSKAGWLGRRAAGPRPRAVLAHTFHGHVLQDYFGPVLQAVARRTERRLARRCDLLFAVSPSCRTELAALGVADAQRIHVVPPAVPHQPLGERSAARRELGLRGFTALFAGRLVAVKGAPAFVEALAGDATLRGVVWGDGPLRAALVERAPSTVRVEPSRPDLGRWLPGFDAVVLPSVREGLPLLAVEAARAGVPVVGYRVPGVEDALETWGAGLLVPPEDGAPGLRRALQALRAQPAMGQELVGRARAGLDRFEPDGVAALLCGHYASALRRRAGAAP